MATVAKFCNYACQFGTRFEIEGANHPDAAQPCLDVAAFRLIVSSLYPNFLGSSGSGATALPERSGKGASDAIAPEMGSPGAVKGVASRMRAFFLGGTYQQGWTIVSLLHLWVLYQYGTFDSSMADSIGLLAMLIMLAELALRVLAFSWSGFWHVPQDVLRQMGNRFDFFVMLLSLLAYIASRYFVVGANQNPLLFALDRYDPSRVAVALPLFRLFTSVQSVRASVLGLLYILPNYSSLLLLLMCVFYVYGVGGCLMLARAFNVVPGYGMVNANFDSFLQGQLTLYQLLVGANWGTLLDVSLLTLSAKDFYRLYLISFVVLMGLLFTNLLLGMDIPPLPSSSGVVGKNAALFVENNPTVKLCA